MIDDVCVTHFLKELAVRVFVKLLLEIGAQFFQKTDGCFVGALGIVNIGGNNQPASRLPAVRLSVPAEDG